MVSLKNSAILFGIFIYFTISCYAAVYTQPAPRHPDYPGKCYDKLTKRPMIPGKEYKAKGICAVMTCNIEYSLIEIETCPHIEMPGCIEIPVDPKRSYPKCCPQYLCTDDEGKEIIIDVTTI